MKRRDEAHAIPVTGASALLRVFTVLLGLLAGLGLLASLYAGQSGRSVSARSPLDQRLQERGVRMGDPVFIRIFKEERILELWTQSSRTNNTETQTSGKTPFQPFDTYPICAMSGALGPKTRQGDRQAPEGVYTVKTGQLNPNSRYHLAFNIGYPNAYERSRGYTGDFIMVHGDCVSIGCFAMTDPGIDEIYGFVKAALEAGQNEVPVHIFPFRLTAENLGRFESARWIEFWTQLKPIYEAFEDTHQPPIVTVQKGTYMVSQ